MGCSYAIRNIHDQHVIENKHDFTFEAGEFGEEIGESIHNKYSLIHPLLGRGQLGEVYKAKHKKTGILRAVKRISRYKLKPYEQAEFEEKIHRYKRLDHPNIIKIFEFYQTESEYFIVSELCTGGELLDKMIEYRTFSEFRAAELMLQILRSLQYCHKQNVFHGALKAESILFASRLPQCCVKISDFGLFKDYTKIAVGKDMMGTPYYLAPELLVEKGDDKADIWSCGVILYLMISGRLPFIGRSDEETMLRIIEGKFNFNHQSFAEASTEVKDLIVKMLQPKKSHRYSSRDCLNHPWFFKFSSKEIDIGTLTKAFKNIRGFTVSSKLQEVIWIHMISMFTAPEQIGQLLEVFKSLDADDDGCLTRVELKTGFMRIGSAEDAEESIRRLEGVLGKETMTFSEFLKCSIHPATLIVESNIQKMFRVFDEDENKHISLGELHKIMGNNKMISIHLLEDFMKEADSDSDGTISFEEFKKLLEELLAMHDDPERHNYLFQEDPSQGV